LSWLTHGPARPSCTWENDPLLRGDATGKNIASRGAGGKGQKGTRAHRQYKISREVTVLAAVRRRACVRGRGYHGNGF